MKRSLSVSLRKAIRRIKSRENVQLVSVEDVTGRAGREQSIPRVVYTTAESRKVHPTHFKSISEFRHLNDDLDFIVFDGENRDHYMRCRWGSHPIFDVYQRALFGQMKADIFRYCIIHDRGGYYVDFNKGIDARITSLHPADSLGLISYEKNPELLFPEEAVASQLKNPFNLVMQWAFGFSSGHPFLRMLLARIVEIEPYFRDKTFKFPKSALLTMSAPGVFTQVFRDYVKLHGISGITEAGEDFHDRGLFRLRGSKLLSQNTPGYDKWRDMKIVSSGHVPNEGQVGA